MIFVLLMRLAMTPSHEIIADLESSSASDWLDEFETSVKRAVAEHCVDSLVRYSVSKVSEI